MVYIKWDLPNKWKGKVRVKIFEYSASREYLLQPDVVEYDKDVMTKPGFDLILCSNTLHVLGIVLDFWAKARTLDDISLPMRDINTFNTQALIEKSWMMNNSIYQDMAREPQSMTKHLMHILDAKYGKANLRDIVKNNCTHLSIPEQSSLLELLQDFEVLFDGTLGDWDCEVVSLQLREGAQSYHGHLFPIPKKHLDVTKRKFKDYVMWEYYNGKLTQNGLHQPLQYQKGQNHQGC